MALLADSRKRRYIDRTGREQAKAMCDKSMLSIDDAPAAAMQCPIAHSLFDAAMADQKSLIYGHWWSSILSPSFLCFLSPPSIDADCWSNWGLC